jgi:hypothetical protein
MKYEHKEWTIGQLSTLALTGKLDLNPAYQRNWVWSESAQERLIATIRSGQPIPNFFIRIVGPGAYEVVDGQQRIRSILAYKCGDISDSDSLTYNDLDPAAKNVFDSYRLSITEISELAPAESIERYYALVNSTGLRVNRPEIFKAEYHNTNFLKLVTESATLPLFAQLKLFTASKRERMEDLDFVSELLSILINGTTDKKEAVNDIFDQDIDAARCNNLSEIFKSVIRHFVRFNLNFPIYRTRYRQKNDFYTLFQFVHNQSAFDPSDLDYYYKCLVTIAPYISPSQQGCDPLKNYANNCVTQSNSKKARVERLNFLNDLFLNPSDRPNDLQLEVMAFLKMSNSDTVRLHGLLTLDNDKIRDPYNQLLSL